MSLELSINRLATALESLVTILLEQAPEELKERVSQARAQETPEPPTGETAAAAVADGPRKTRGKAKAPAAAAPADPKPVEVTLDEIRELMKAVDRKFGRNELMDLLSRFGVTRLSDVDQGQYLLLKKALEKQLEGGSGE